jgi:putative acetyltransferase
MRIRKARPEDAKEISKLVKQTFKNVNSKDYPTKEHILFFNSKNTKKKILKKIKKYEMFCIIEKNNIIGTVHLRGDMIGGFYIKHDQVRKGVGTRLLKFIEDYARKKGIKKVWLYSTKYGYPFYLKNNYKLVKKGFWKVNNSRAINYNMEKKL